MKVLGLAMTFRRMRDSNSFLFNNVATSLLLLFFVLTLFCSVCCALKRPVRFLLLWYSVLCTVESSSLLFYILIYVFGDDALIN